MILVRLKGGLGNQMFQYAAGRALAHRHGVKLVLDTRYFSSYQLRGFGLDRFAVAGRLATSEELSRWPNWQRHPAKVLQWIGLETRWYRQSNFGYDTSWPSLGNDLLIDGYFQSEKYFLSIAEILANEFIPRESLSSENIEVLEQIRNNNCVMIHVRRGDYVTDAKTMATHGICTLDYYNRSIKFMYQSVVQPKFIVFSDDIEWSRQNLGLEKNAIYVEGNVQSPEVDIYLMTQCRHHIIANSSFSWWGSWLNRQPGKLTIAPKNWFATDKLCADELVPEKWLRL